MWRRWSAVHAEGARGGMTRAPWGPDGPGAPPHVLPRSETGACMGGLRACVCACVRARVCVCACVFVCAYAHAALACSDVCVWGGGGGIVLERERRTPIPTPANACERIECMLCTCA